MLCDRCHKREATMHYVQVVNGLRKEEHLCPECAAEQYQNAGNRMGGMHSWMNSLFDDSLFRDLWSDPMSALHSMACRSCGTTLDTFQKEGLLGCPDCYETFRENLKPFFRRAQEGIQHEGKAPGMADTGKEEQTSPEIEQLKTKLAALVKEENYEEAARVRDEIKRLEQGGQS